MASDDSLILIISHAKDPHARRVLQLLEQAGRGATLLDLSALPEATALTIAYDPAGVRRAILTASGSESVDLLAARSVWWRRPQVPNLSAIQDPDILAFTHNEWHEAIQGLWQLVPAPWMNPPPQDEVASRKALQLHLAARSGLGIPPTLITSDPAMAREFLERQGQRRTIFKTFSCTHAIWRETRLVEAGERELLEHVRWAPVIFQDYIEADADVRVTVVGDRVFAAAIDTSESDYRVDFRMSLGQARMTPTELPEPLTGRLLSFMRSLGLVYGAIDLRRTPSGDYVFLEVNTAGEFLFVEERTGLPIAQAVADWLITPRGERLAAASRRSERLGMSG
jgi:glutathione synthase/RimK-type ligase-like ATP-grasp enzyme